MNQAEHLSEINFLLKLVNDSTEQKFNFSEDVARDLINEYLSDMNTLHRPETITLIVLYIPVFLLSLLGNSLVIFVVVRNPAMRKVKNVFLVNLACADLGVTLICMPIVAASAAFRVWVYGDFLCKFTGYIQGVAVTASIWTLAALSIDRYLAIRVPLSMRRLRRGVQALQAIILIWLVSGLLIGPMLYVRSVTNIEFERFDIHISYCIEKWDHFTNKKAYAIFLLVAMYAAPIFVISLCYILIGKTLCVSDLHRKSSNNSSTITLGRKKVARMLIALICVFLLCWLPYNICSLSLDIQMDLLDSKVLPFTLLFAHTHSAVNPFLYWFLNKGFRGYMKKAMKCQYIRAIRDQPFPQFVDDMDDVCGPKFRAVQHYTRRGTSYRDPGDLNWASPAPLHLQRMNKRLSATTTQSKPTTKSTYLFSVGAVVRAHPLTAPSSSSNGDQAHDSFLRPMNKPGLYTDHNSAPEPVVYHQLEKCASRGRNARQVMTIVGGELQVRLGQISDPVDSGEADEPVFIRNNPSILDTNSSDNGNNSHLDIVGVCAAKDAEHSACNIIQGAKDAEHSACNIIQVEAEMSVASKQATHSKLNKSSRKVEATNLKHSREAQTVQSKAQHQKKPVKAKTVPQISTSSSEEPNHSARSCHQNGDMSPNGSTKPYPPVTLRLPQRCSESSRSDSSLCDVTWFVGNSEIGL